MNSPVWMDQTVVWEIIPNATKLYNLAKDDFKAIAHSSHCNEKISKI